MLQILVLGVSFFFIAQLIELYVKKKQKQKQLRYHGNKEKKFK